MAAIHSKDTKPEMIVRKGLWNRGFRYRLNSPRLPGHPDLVLKKYRTCIFVNGCFWHGHNVEVRSEKGGVKSSECCKIPNSNQEFWVAKIKRNQEGGNGLALHHHLGMRTEAVETGTDVEVAGIHP